jgi:polyhydroxyalkanoate synthesis repressor PhaR
MNRTATVIKKYGNRRLYDTAASRYINLDEIAAMIRRGEDVQVVDAKTGEDLTRVILTQIILDDAKGQPTGLPLELLRQLVVASDQVGREFIMWYLQSAFDAFHKVQDTLHGGLSGMQSAALSPLQMMRNFIRGSEPERPPAPPPEPTQELRELRRRLADLEAKLAKPKAQRKRRK